MVDGFYLNWTRERRTSHPHRREIMLHSGPNDDQATVASRGSALTATESGFRLEVNCDSALDKIEEILSASRALTREVKLEQYGGSEVGATALGLAGVQSPGLEHSLAS